VSNTYCIVFLSYLRYLYLFSDSGVQHILYCVFVLSYLRYLYLFSYSGVQHILLCFCFVFFVSVVSVSGLSIVIVPSVLANV
jgi:hypothetical protein